jgi:hypothetical protein
MIDIGDSDLSWTDEEIDALFEPKPVSRHDQAILDSLEPIDWSLVTEKGSDLLDSDGGPQANIEEMYSEELVSGKQ